MLHLVDLTEFCGLTLGNQSTGILSTVNIVTIAVKEVPEPTQLHWVGRRYCSRHAADYSGEPGDVALQPNLPGFTSWSC